MKQVLSYRRVSGSRPRIRRAARVRSWRARSRFSAVAPNSAIRLSGSSVTAPAVSGDLNYSGFDTFGVFVTNTDDDTAGITVSPTSGLTTTEAGGTGSAGALLLAAFNKRLNMKMLREVIESSALTNALVFFIIFGATLDDEQ